MIKKKKKKKRRSTHLRFIAVSNGRGVKPSKKGEGKKTMFHYGTVLHGGVWYYLLELVLKLPDEDIAGLLKSSIIHNK